MSKLYKTLALGAIPLVCLSMTGRAQTVPPEPEPYSLGAAEAYPSIPFAQRPFVFRHMEELTPYPVRPVRHGGNASSLPIGKVTDVQIGINGKTTDIAGFMADNHVCAMLVIRDGKIIFERYRQGNTPLTRWVMFSASKSVTSTLLAAALNDRAIHSLDDQIVRYLPQLKGSAWDGVTLRHALSMSSGVELHDVYESKTRTGLAAAYLDKTPGAPLRYLATLPRAHAPGTHFSYSGANTYVLGRVIAAATGKSLSDYLSEKIWKPMGMADDALWRLDQDGYEVAQGGLSATLRDMGRFGLFALHQGRIGSKRVVPADWFEQASDTRGAIYLRPGGATGFAKMGYGYQWWTMASGGLDYPAYEGTFAAQGIYGQQVYVVPKKNMVVVLQSATLNPVPLKEVGHAQSIVMALSNQP